MDFVSFYDFSLLKKFFFFPFFSLLITLSCWWNRLLPSMVSFQCRLSKHASSLRALVDPDGSLYCISSCVVALCYYTCVSAWNRFVWYGISFFFRVQESRETEMVRVRVFSPQSINILFYLNLFIRKFLNRRKNVLKKILLDY